MEKVNKLLDSLEAERRLQRKEVERTRETSRYEVHLEIYNSLERIIERMSR